MASEKFCLRWNDFEANISSAFREIRDDKEFFDVTLASEDENQIQAHKVIIGACSPFFRNILRKNSHNHPLLYLKGVKYKELVSVLNFMYHGEVNVAQDDLNSFLAVAEELRVKGLTQGQGGSKGEPQKTEAAKTVPIRPRDEPAPKRSRPNPTPPQVQSAQGSSLFSTYQDDDITEVVPVKSEPGTSQMAGQVDNAVALEEQQQYDESYDYGQYEEGYDDGTGAMVDPNTGMPIQAGDGNKGPIVSWVCPQTGYIHCSKGCGSKFKNVAPLKRHEGVCTFSNLANIPKNIPLHVVKTDRNVGPSNSSPKQTLMVKNFAKSCHVEPKIKEEML